MIEPCGLLMCPDLTGSFHLLLVVSYSILPCKLILDTNVNLTNPTTFIHYVGYPPHQSASIPVARHFSTHGYFSPNIPECFISDHKNGFLKGDIVVLGQDTGQKVVMEEIVKVGRHFILYKVKDVGSIPMGGV